MKEHAEIISLLPFYAAGTLTDTDRKLVAQHLSECATCREEYGLWQDVSSEIQAANDPLLVPVLRSLPLKMGKPSRLWKTWYILCSQRFLIRKDVWISSALVMMMGVIIALIFENVDVIYILAPFLSAAGIAYIYGMQNDPALELTLSTPVSPHQILMARLSLVFGYNILLTFMASLLVLIFTGQLVHFSWVVLLDWIAPMAFLSSLALFCSLLWGSMNAVAFAYSLWIVKGILGKMEVFNTAPGIVYISPELLHMFEVPSLLFLLSAGLILLTMWFADQKKSVLLH